jgi:hypothetical protein
LPNVPTLSACYSLPYEVQIQMFLESFSGLFGLLIFAFKVTCTIYGNLWKATQKRPKLNAKKKHRNSTFIKSVPYEVQMENLFLCCSINSLDAVEAKISNCNSHGTMRIMLQKPNLLKNANFHTFQQVINVCHMSHTKKPKYQKLV